MRIFYYSHDTYGEGHLQQTLAFAKQIARDFPGVTQLIVSGTSQPRGLKFPENLDFIKLPRLDESIMEDFHSPSLDLPFEAIQAMRVKIILETIKHFKPDVVLVKSPTMAQREILPALHYLKRNRSETKIVMDASHDESMPDTLVRRTLSERKAFATSQASPPVDAQREDLRVFSKMA